MHVVTFILIKLIEKKLETFKIHVVFMARKVALDAIFAVRNMIEKYGKVKKKLYFVMIDLEKALEFFIPWTYPNLHFFVWTF